MEITSRNYSSASADDAVERKAKRAMKREHYSKKRSKTMELRATMTGRMKRSKHQFDCSRQPLFGFKNSSLALFSLCLQIQEIKSLRECAVVIYVCTSYLRTTSHNSNELAVDQMIKSSDHKIQVKFVNNSSG